MVVVRGKSFWDQTTYLEVGPPVLKREKLEEAASAIRTRRSFQLPSFQSFSALGRRERARGGKRWAPEGKKSVLFFYPQRPRKLMQGRSTKVLLHKRMVEEANLHPDLPHWGGQARGKRCAVVS